MLLCQYSTSGSCGATEDAAVACQGRYKINVIDVSQISDLLCTYACIVDHS